MKPTKSGELGHIKPERSPGEMWPHLTTKRKVPDERLVQTKRQYDILHKRHRNKD